MNILMLGWEYPPHITGGLGVASQGIAEALAKQAEVTFLLPKKHKEQVSQKVTLIDLAELSKKPSIWNKKIKKTEIMEETSIGQTLVPYLPPILFTKTKSKSITTIELTPKQETALLGKIKLTGSYEEDLLGQVSKYAFLATHFAKKRKYDFLHAHDWPTFKAAISLKKSLKIPLAIHIHSTEFERNGIFAQNTTIELEKEGIVAADIIFTVSKQTKDLISSRYGIDASKIKVIPNAVDLRSSPAQPRKPKKIGFIGRFTHQKSPATFLDLARSLASKGLDFDYTMMGDGYLADELKNKANSLNLKIKFTGFLTRQKLLKKLNTLDLLVVPSNAEPFGLVTLEAIMKKIPVAAAQGSGVAEFIPSLPQVDKWNHFEYVQLIEQLMTKQAYRQTVIDNCLSEASQLSWKRSAQEILSGYTSILNH